MRLIIFDLDGTLIDSLEDLAAATNAMLSHFNRPQLPSVEIRKLIGEGARRLVERALPGASTAEVDEGLAIFLDYNDRHIADFTVLYQGVPETLEELRRRGFILTVASNKNEDLCRKILGILGIENFFEAVLGADSVSRRKPDPEPVLTLMERFAVTAAETMMIGDSINDIAAGKGAGVATVACTFGYGSSEEISGAHYFVRSFSSILRLPPFL